MSLRPLMVLLLASAPIVARADEPPAAAPSMDEPASELFRDGLTEYDAGRYRRAIDLFSRAYEHSHAPALLFNEAQAWRLLGNCTKAVALYEAFVSESPSSPNVERARSWLERMRPCHEAGALKAPAAGVAAAPSISLQPIPPPPAPSGHPFVVGVLGGASVVFAGAGWYAAWRANDLSNQTGATFDKGGTWTADAATLQREGKRAQLEGFVFLSAALASGLAAYLVHRWSSSP
jgi:hypothetical protein